MCFFAFPAAAVGPGTQVNAIVRSVRRAASLRGRLRAVSETSDMARVPARLHPVRVPRLQPTVHGRRP